jgi:transposase
LAHWLRTHPGVKVIARDRATAYAEGARQGAAAATQVADRFHLLQKLREALDQVFATQRQALEAVNALERQQPVVSIITRKSPPFIS